MNKFSRRVIAAASAVALAGGTALAMAGPASASAAIPAFPGADNFSYGASGGFTGPVAEAENSFGEHVATQGSFSILSHLVSGGNVADTAFDNGASSSVAGVNVRGILAEIGLSARLVRSTCDDNGDASTTILDGVVGLGRSGVPIDTFPSTDEEIDLPGGAEVFLNDQSNFDGELTVNALAIDLPGGGEITVGTSVCEDDD
jgi:hypothetical protein